MAKLYISEYTTTGAFTNTSVPIAIEPSRVTQVVDFTSGATQSAAFDGKTNYVRLWSDTDCCVLFGNNPTADTDKLPLAANTPEYFGVPGPVGNQKISVVALS